MRALPFQHFRLCFRVGKPQGRAVVMRDSEPDSLSARRRCPARPTRVPGSSRDPSRHGRYALAGAIRKGTVFVECERVDPAPLVSARFAVEPSARSPPPGRHRRRSRNDRHRSRRRGIPRLDARRRDDLLAPRQQHRAITKAKGQRALQPAERRHMGAAWMAATFSERKADPVLIRQSLESGAP